MQFNVLNLLPVFTVFFHCPGKNSFCHGKIPTLLICWLLQWKVSVSWDVLTSGFVQTSITDPPSCFAAVQRVLTMPLWAFFNSGNLDPSLCQSYCLTTFQLKVC